MRELLRTNDLAEISWIRALLSDAEIVSVVLDGHMSVVEGSLGILARRVMVADEDHARACRLLQEAGEGALLK
ncbi:MAG TPA: DUF2007 domain-containing protein [Kiloniellaceae bacterium]|nr:DUF2007 domain-containing protein [Kiloniellaceae bacterium]